MKGRGSIPARSFLPHLFLQGRGGVSASPQRHLGTSGADTSTSSLPRRPCFVGIGRSPPECGGASFRFLLHRTLNTDEAALANQNAGGRLGAPLGHDFCAISLSDNLKPWAIVERRLRAAADADFVIALYNPASKARPDQIHHAFALLRARKHAATPVAFARAIGRNDERITLTTLADADPSQADMSTLVLIGSSETRLIERPDNPPWLLTPRTYGAGE